MRFDVLIMPVISDSVLSAAEMWQWQGVSMKVHASNGYIQCAAAAACLRQCMLLQHVTRGNVYSHAATYLGSTSGLELSLLLDH